ncbi:hypothetical protein TNCV_3344531 [Trichonephila clavipes]|nr:hypothetical protein TNCV_3344531 [Trichonephila clavipes]
MKNVESKKQLSFIFCFGEGSIAEKRAALSSQPCQKTLNISHPDEARLPRLPDSMDQPITDMPLSRMHRQAPHPSYHDKGLRTEFRPTPKSQRLSNVVIT